MCKVLIADDHPLFRDALRSAVAYTFADHEVLEAATLDEALAVVRAQGELDLVLLDLNMPGMNGFNGLLTLRAQFPGTPVVMVSASDDRRLMLDAINYGAVGFIPKSLPRDDIAAALHAIVAGEVYLPQDVGRDDGTGEADGEAAETARRLATLTAQQLRVLEMLGTGKLNKEIAYELNIAETTVKAHVSAILQKLKVYSRTQAVVFAGRLKLERPAGMP